MAHEFNNLVGGSKTLGSGVRVSYDTNARANGRNFRVSVFISHLGEEVKREAFEAPFDSGVSGESDRNRMVSFINSSVNEFVSNNSESIDELKNIFSPAAFSVIERMMDRMTNRIEELEDRINDLESRQD